MSPAPRNIAISEHFCRALAKFRKEIGWTKAELAERSGLSERTIRDLESCRRSRIQEKTLNLLAESLGIHPNQLQPQLSGADSDNPSSPPARTARKRPGSGVMLALIVAPLLFIGAATILWNFARTNAKWTNEHGVLTVRDAVFGTTLWQLADGPLVSSCIDSPWSKRQIIAGLGSNSPEGGLVLCLDRATGDTIWSVRPDLDALIGAFGTDDVMAAGFSCKRLWVADLDGDGEPQLVAQFVHGLYYPTAIGVFDRSGHRQSQYANRGHLFDLVVTDLDNDGKDELIFGGVNNSHDYMGATLFVLDDECRTGASADDRCNPWSTEPDSARARVVMPNYPAPYMNQLSLSRLSVTVIKVYQHTRAEKRIIAHVGWYGTPGMVVQLDSDLHPLQAFPTDELLVLINSTWPDSLKQNTGPSDPEWCAQWLSTAVTFEAGHWPPEDRRDGAVGVSATNP